ncbi:MAG: TolC family protein, partial [Leptospira sp.]|nr:TolC family protein [Leptospira sp.]
AFRNYPARGGSYSLSDRQLDTPTMTGIEYSVSQEIPFPGRLTLQGKVGKQNEMEFSHYSKSLKNRFVQDFFTNVIKEKSAEHKIALNKLILKNLESQKNIVASGISSGSSSLSKALKIQVGITMARDRELSFSEDRKTASQSLEYFKPENFPKSDEKFFTDIRNYLQKKESGILSGIKELRSKLENNPNYRLSIVAAERVKNEGKLASLTHAPDAEVFFAYMKRRRQNFAIDNGPLNYQIMDTTEYRDDLFSFGVNVRVPVWSFFKSKDLSERSNENSKSKQFEIEKNRLYLESSLSKQLARLNSVNEQLDLHTKELVPQSEKTIAALSSQYNSKKIDLAEVWVSKLELLNIHITQEELLEKKYLTLLSILELTDDLYQDMEQGKQKGFSNE